MKGIVLGGGLGSRLLPLTNDDNKHMLPVYNRRMIEYPLSRLVEAGIEDIVLVTGGRSPGKFLEYLKNGKSLGIKRLYYTYQEGNGGIADALKLAKPFIKSKEPVVVILGDNYFEDSLVPYLSQWKEIGYNGASVLVQPTLSPRQFGIAEVVNEKIVSIEEKPLVPKSNLAILGCYFLDYTLWKKLERVTLSQRGELEITDVLKLYMLEEALSYGVYNSYWSDMGTFQTWSDVAHRLIGRDICY